MMTAVGLTAEETLASVRAGTARFSASDMRDRHFDPFTVAEVPPDGLPPLIESLQAEARSAREERLWRLATGPITRAMAVPRAPTRVPLFVALPERETRLPLDTGRFLTMLGRQANAIDLKGSRADFKGRAGGVSAIGAAAGAIAEGKMPFALAGGVDSFLDLYVLATLDMEARVKSASHLDGFIPAEGAAFVLLASRTAAESLAIKPLARVSPAAGAMESGHLYSKETYKGEGLSEALRQLFATSAPSAPVKAVWTSMNGESHWGKEWGVASIRNKKFIAPDARLNHPADCFGDIGAAAGAALVGIAAHGIAGGYRPAPALGYGSNDEAPRAAMLVSAA